MSYVLQISSTQEKKQQNTGKKLRKKVIFSATNLYKELIMVMKLIFGSCFICTHCIIMHKCNAPLAGHFIIKKKKEKKKNNIDKVFLSQIK